MLSVYESKFCDPCRIQTCNLLIRSQILYSVELMGLVRQHDTGFFQKRLQRYCFFLN